MRFKTRLDAAARLADALGAYAADRPLVLGIPRGGVPMARLVAERLRGDLDVALVHKLRAPFQPELAVGSIDDAGHVYLAPFATSLGISDDQLRAEQQAQLDLLRARRQRYSAAQPRLSRTGRVVIIVDDGIATGATAIAAARAARLEGARTVVVAAAVAPPSTVSQLQREADAVVCLETPEDFGAVGEFFEDFGEVTDEQVVRDLAEHHATPAKPS